MHDADSLCSASHPRSGQRGGGFRPPHARRPLQRKGRGEAPLLAPQTREGEAEPWLASEPRHRTRSPGYCEGRETITMDGRGLWTVPGRGRCCLPVRAPALHQEPDPEYWRSEISAFPDDLALHSLHSHDHHSLQKALFTQDNEVPASTRLPWTQGMAFPPPPAPPHWPGALVSVASLQPRPPSPSTPPRFCSAVPGEPLHFRIQPCKVSVPSSHVPLNCKEWTAAEEDLFLRSPAPRRGGSELCRVGLWEMRFRWSFTSCSSPSKRPIAISCQLC